MEVLPSNPRVKYKRATAEEIKEFYDGKVPFTAKALLFYYDNEVAAIGGIKFEDGLRMAFSEIKDGVKAPRKTVLQCAFKVMEFCKEDGVVFYARSLNPRLLKKVGFSEYDTIEGDGEFFIWN